jgi:hypothetical protein
MNKEREVSGLLEPYDAKVCAMSRTEGIVT